MLTLIDNYDSFTYNLVHFLGELGASTRVYRNDKVSVDDVLAEGPEAIVLSPGPCDPDRAGICLDLIERAAPVVPILGVCLGHQAIGQVYGGRVVRAPTLMHGKLSKVHHTGKGVFSGLPQDFSATRYHSLVVERASLPEPLEITAETADGVIMGLQHKRYPVYGVQVHPESIASEQGHQLLANFLNLARVERRARGSAHREAAGVLSPGAGRAHGPCGSQQSQQQGRVGAKPDSSRSGRGLRPDHVGCGDRRADWRPAHWHARQSGDRGGNRRRRSRPQSASDPSARA